MIMDIKPVLALCYDFDKTLSPENMQDGYIRSLGLDVDTFWSESNLLADKHHMDSNLAYMYKMIDEAVGKVIPTQQHLRSYGQRVPLYKGLETWFERMNILGNKYEVQIEHYIISSGLREIIEGTSIAPYFKHIYASAFYYDERGVPRWPAQAINYTNKTQFLFRIEKGTLDINDNHVNKHFAEGELRVPFRNIVYIEASATDIPCMRLVNSLGGHSIGVYDRSNKKSKEQVYQMIKDKRIRYYVPTDYSKDSEMYKLIKSIIRKTAAYEVLENKYLQDKKQAFTSLF